MNPDPARGDLGPLESAADEVLVFDLAGRVVAANAAATRALGRSRDELAGCTAWDVLTRLSRVQFDWLVGALRTEGAQELLAHLCHADGTRHAVEVRLWLAALGGEERVHALARGVRSHQALIEEREQLAGLVETSSETIAMATRDGTLSYLNPAGMKAIGIARAEDVAGLGLHELFAPQERVQIEEVVLPRVQRESWEGELTLFDRASGALTPCSVQAYAVRHSKSGRTVGLALVARDVSKQKAAEVLRRRMQALNEVSRDVARSLLEQDDLNRAVFMALAGVARALDVPRAFLSRVRDDRAWIFRTHEWSRERGEEHRLQAAPESVQRYRSFLEPLAHGEVVKIDDTSMAAFRRHCDEGGQGILTPSDRALLVVPVTIDGKLEGMIGFADDVPRSFADEEISVLQVIVDSFARGVERRIAERGQAQALRDLERSIERERAAIKSKGEFLANISHELRTPMNAIRGYAELLSRARGDHPSRDSWTENLRRSADYLLSLVNDVLDLSKVEAGHMQLVTERASLAGILTSVEDLLCVSAREKCLKFEVSVEGTVPESFETDATRLKQILVNLAGNAIKFTNEGGVRLRVRALTRETGGERVLEIAVIDTGIGIAAETLGRLFRPFSQAQRNMGGTGLGLEISRHLAQHLGGDIGVESVVGKGSTFTLRLPLSGAEGTLGTIPHGASQRAAKGAGLPAVLQGARYLVVDDSAENREVLRFLLHEAGATCETADDGAAGVTAALAAEQEESPFDAILMDMNMPVVDGFEATRRIVAAGIRTPVIALTALATRDDEERCQAAGCVDHVSKPIVPSELFETLARHARAAGLASASSGSEHARRGRDADELPSVLDHPRFRPLIERYVASFPRLIRDIRDLQRAGRLDEVRTLVHRLRGTAASYGFPGISRCAGTCEEAIRSGAGTTDLARSIEDLIERLSHAAAG